MTKSPAASIATLENSWLLRGVGVDLELGSLGHAGGVITLGIDAVAAAVLAVALPGDDEVAGGIHGHLGKSLIAGGVGVDLEFAALGHAGRVVALGVDAVAAAILAIALPGDDEVAGGIHGHAGEFLIAGGVRVDLELGSPGPRRPRCSAGHRCRSRCRPGHSSARR